MTSALVERILHRPLLSDALREDWGAVERGGLAADEYERRRDDGLRAYRALWEHALCLPPAGLEESLVAELARYVGCDVVEARRRCERAVEAVAADWIENVRPGDDASVERYYDRTEHFLYDLTWWHTLRDDQAPLAYVSALHFARRHGTRRYLDFGSGIGAGGLLFHRHDHAVTLADVSSSLLAFSRWRFATRDCPVRTIDLKTEPLPEAAFDFITAMDVFEHLTDPVAAVDRLWHALAPGGYLCGRFHGDVDEARPQHIVVDFEPTFRRLAELGMREVWRDDWLWGHQIFQRT